MKYNYEMVHFISVCKKAQEAYQPDVFYGCEKVKKTFWFCNFFMLERQRIYSSQKGLTGLNWVCERGTFSVKNLV